MTKTRIIIATAFVTSAVAYSAFSWKTIMTDLQNRFPDVPKKDLRIAYLTFVKKSFNGELGDTSYKSDEDMDDLFMVELVKLRNK